MLYAMGIFATARQLIIAKSGIRAYDIQMRCLWKINTISLKSVASSDIHIESVEKLKCPIYGVLQKEGKEGLCLLFMSLSIHSRKVLHVIYERISIRGFLLFLWLDDCGR